jgi:hypothetical protein
MTRADVLALPVVMSVDLAAQAWGISKGAGAGTFPVRTVMVGRYRRVLRADLLAALRIRDSD